MTNETEDFTRNAQRFGADYLPGLLGLNFTGFGDGWVEANVEIKKSLMAPNGFLHAGTVVTLADSACGYGCVRALPEGAAGFTTIELKSNFLRTARDGVIECRAEAKHLGAQRSFGTPPSNTAKLTRSLRSFAVRKWCCGRAVKRITLRGSSVKRFQGLRPAPPQYPV